MIVPVSINADDLEKAFQLTQQQSRALVTTVVQSLGLAAQREWVDLAEQHSVSMGARYRNGVQIFDTRWNVVEVALVGGLVNSMEVGKQPWDMKPFYANSGKRKMSKKGGWYVTVPFRWATPSAIGDNDVFTGKLPLEVYRAVNDQGGKLTQSTVPAPFDAIQTRPTRINTETGQIFSSYAHQASIYAGLKKQTDPQTGQSSYRSWRRISSKSDTSSWIHPGFQALNFKDKVVENIDVEQIVGNAIDDFVRNLK